MLKKQQQIPINILKLKCIIKTHKQPQQGQNNTATSISLSHSNINQPIKQIWRKYLSDSAQRNSPESTLHLIADLESQNCIQEAHFNNFPPARWTTEDLAQPGAQIYLNTLQKNTFFLRDWFLKVQQLKNRAFWRWSANFH